MKLPAPNSIKSLANSFLFYQEEVGVESVLDTFDWDNVSPLQVYSAALGRLPETLDVALPPPDYSARNHINNVLHSEEFQMRSLALMLKAFEEKRRLIFIHVPKCAGSDLVFNLSERYPFLSSDLCNLDWTSKAALFRRLKAFSAEANASDSLFIAGHITLSDVLYSEMYRFGDKAFTIVREPVSRVVSQVNYILAVLKGDRGLERPDRRAWLDQLGLDRLSRRAPRAQLQELGRVILRREAMVPKNGLCAALGLGDLHSALDAAGRCDIEITDTSRYGAWLQTRWGVPRSRKLNRSSPILTPKDLTKDDLDYVRSICVEDFKFYDAVQRELNAASALSVGGLALAASAVNRLKAPPRSRTRAPKAAPTEPPALKSAA